MSVYQRLCTLFLVLSLLVLPSLLTAQTSEDREGEDDGTVKTLDEYTVTGTPSETEVFDTVSDVDVLTGEEKRRRQTTSLGESIDHFPGVSSIGTGPQAGKPVIRGLSGNRIRVLEDGIGVHFQQFGVRHPPNIDPLMADRIEVVRGASSVLYGSDAIGGAVNVIPHKPTYAPEGEWQSDGRLTTKYATNNEQSTNALKFDAAYGTFGLAADLVYRDAGNVTTPDVKTFADGDTSGDAPGFSGELPFTDFEQTNGNIVLGHQGSAGEVTLRYTKYHNEQNVLLPPPPFPGGGGPDPGPTGVDGLGQLLENDILQFKSDLNINDTWSLKPSMTYARNERLAAGRGNTRPVHDPAIDVLRENYTGRVELQHEDGTDPLKGRLGVEVVREDQESNGPVGLTPGGEINNLSAFAFEELDLDPFILEGGVRLDYRNQEADPDKTRDSSLFTQNGRRVDLDNSFQAVSASLGPTYWLTDYFAVAGNISRGFRAPDLFELYANGVHGGVAALQRGNASLDEETSLSTNLSMRWRSDRIRARATVYRNAIDNFIFPADTGQSSGQLPIFQFSQEDAVLKGADISAEVDVYDWLTIRGMYEMVDGELTDSGADVPLIPADQLTLAARFHRSKLAVLDNPYVTIRAENALSKDAAGTKEPFSQFDNAPFGSASTGAYVLLDLRAGFTWRDVLFSMNVENVLDRAYRDFLDTYKGYALSPGRNVTFSVSLDF